MSLAIAICCLHCGNIYKNSNRPCIGTCTHSICETCHVTQQNAPCPVCQRNDAFVDKNINYHFIDMMRTVGKQNLDVNFSVAQQQLEQIYDGTCVECGEFSSRLRFCTDCHPGIFERERDGRWRLKTISGLRRLRNFITAKCVSICGNCALDKHDGHEITSLKTDERFSEYAAFRLEMVLKYFISQNIDVVSNTDFGHVITDIKKDSLIMKGPLPVVDESMLDLQFRSLQKKYERFRKKNIKSDKKYIKMFARNILLHVEWIEETLICIDEALRTGELPDSEEVVREAKRDLEKILAEKPNDLETYISSEDVIAIDSELDWRMERLASRDDLEARLQSLNIGIESEELRTHPNYSKFNALLSEIHESARALESAESEFKRRSDLLAKHRANQKLLVELDAKLIKMKKKRKTMTTFVYKRLQKRIYDAATVWKRKLFKLKYDELKANWRWEEARRRRSWTSLMDSKFFRNSLRKSEVDDEFITQLKLGWAKSNALKSGHF